MRKVYATARDPEALRDLRDERLVPLRLDVTDAEQFRAAGRAAPDVELVFNNAGVALAAGIADPTVLDQARREMEVNYFGPLLLLHHLAPTLVRGAVQLLAEGLERQMAAMLSRSAGGALPDAAPLTQAARMG